MPRDLHSRAGIDEWLQSLDDRWPARAEVSKHIVAEIEALPTFDPHVVELAPGGGKLADQLLRTLPGTYASRKTQSFNTGQLARVAKNSVKLGTFFFSF